MNETAIIHDRRCVCLECEERAKLQFEPYRIKQWHFQGYVAYPCLKCNRPNTPISKGGFLIWQCWECSFKRAIVTNVFPQGDKQFGFAKREDGETVYFHFSTQKAIISNGSDFPIMLDITQNVLIPEVDEEIIYREIMGRKSFKAYWWAFHSEYNEAKEAIINRPTYRFIYRDGRRTAYDNIQILWEGTNLVNLNNTFSKYNYAVQERGIYAYYFEILNTETGTWEICDDPR